MVRPDWNGVTQNKRTYARYRGVLGEHRQVNRVQKETESGHAIRIVSLNIRSGQAGDWILRCTHYRKKTSRLGSCRRGNSPGRDLVQATRYGKWRLRDNTGEGFSLSVGKRRDGRLKEREALGRTL